MINFLTHWSFVGLGATFFAVGVIVAIRDWRRSTRAHRRYVRRVR